ncbi:MAG TPA: hypothetical protein VHV80_09685 [Steroidobacteraceae bacterium]|nr:hypothetical protein [Steroidobacteraceae bacterium]
MSLHGARGTPAGLHCRRALIAGGDCGYGTFAGFGPVEPDIVYMKLGALVAGARIASGKLWGSLAAAR